jgi:hypothetical protein
MMRASSASVGAVAVGPVGAKGSSANVLIVAACARVIPAVAGYVLDDSVSDARPAAPLCGVGCDC